jgi:hypothetical protein
MRGRLSPKEIETFKRARLRGRTDLLFLCREILGYDRVDAAVHKGIVGSVQKFDECQGADTVTAEGWFRYQPKWEDPEPLVGPRRRLILDARGHYKTTINSIAHTIQWVLNFPDINILMVHASLEQAQEKFAEVRDHFRYNKTLRYFFPEFCPPLKSAHNWGTEMELRVTCRARISGTPTVTCSGIEKVKAGSHYHVIKFFDVVEKENSQTPEQVKKTIRSFGAFRNLLVSAKHWMDVEGTRYHYSDLYGTIIESYLRRLKEENKARAAGLEVVEDPLRWRFYVRGCYKKDLKGAEPTYQPEELDAPYVLDEKGHRVPVFPAINSYEDLEAMRSDPSYGPDLFAAQMLNNPVDTEESSFPLATMQWVPDEKIARVPGHHEVTMDTADTANEGSNDSVITTCKVDRMQRRWARDVRVDRMLPSEIVAQLFQVIMRYKPMVVKIEETAFVRGLRVEIDRKAAELGVYPNFVFLKRDTQLSKRERILNTLQPWYKAGMLRFSDDLPEHVKERLRHELSRFPKWKDDVLDTLADQFQGQEYFGPLEGRMEPEDPDEAEAKRKMEEQKYMTRAFVQMMQGDPVPAALVDPMTGL